MGGHREHAQARSGRAMSATDDFGGLVFMEQGSLDDRSTGAVSVGPGKLYPILLILLAGASSVLLFVGPIASAGASLIGSDLSWSALVSAGTAALYGVCYQIHQWRNSKLRLVPEKIMPTRVSTIIAHGAVFASSITVMVLLAVAPSASWVLFVSRSLLVIEASAIAVSGGHQIYSGAKFIEAQRLMTAYEAVTSCEGSSLALDAQAWEDLECAQRVLGTETVQADRIHFLESQRAELAAELVRLTSKSYEAPTSMADFTPEHDVLKKFDEQTAQMRSLRASQNALAEQLEQSQAASTEQQQVTKTVEEDLQAEKDLNEKLNATMDQMKAVLETAVQSRDDARYKYKMLKKSVTKMVKGAEPIKTEGRARVKSETLGSNGRFNMDLNLPV